MWEWLGSGSHSSTTERCYHGSNHQRSRTRGLCSAILMSLRYLGIPDHEMPLKNIRSVFRKIVSYIRDEL